MKILTNDEVIKRLRDVRKTQTEWAKELHVSRSFINHVLTAKKSHPTPRMLDQVGVERRTVYVEKGTFPQEYQIPVLPSKGSEASRKK